MIFLASVAATLVFFNHSGDIIHINISSSVGVEPTNPACAPSTATSDVPNHYTIEASPNKDAQLAYITTPDAAVHSEYGFYINYFSVQNYDISRICSSDTCLFQPQWRHNPYKYSTYVGLNPRMRRARLALQRLTSLTIRTMKSLTILSFLGKWYECLCEILHNIIYFKSLKRNYSKTCEKWPLKIRQNKDLNDKW